MKDYEWKFDKTVAKIFDNHAPKHIPDYQYIINSLPNILKSFNIKKEDPILEIGCATGQTIKKLYYNNFTNLYATETSIDMLNTCPKNIASYTNTNKIPIKNYKVILMYYKY